MRNRAFTLVELSIVLVILGLIVGGVLTGQSLIRAAELRSVTTQEQRYVAAIQTFRDKYFALPGDMTNAQSYWGVANATASTCVTTVGIGTQTCNGDGNGQVDLSAGANEPYRLWQHLTNAGLIEGNYSGVAGGGSTVNSLTSNSPSGRISGSLWLAYWFGTMNSGINGLFNGQYGNALEIGMPTSTLWPYGPIVKPEDAYNIDVKMDDGRPATGTVVISAVAGLANCTDTSSANTLTANYLLTSNALGCAMVFRQAY